jgi:hypothetical protein
MHVSCVAYSSSVKMEATCSSETSVHFHRITGRYIPEGRITSSFGRRYKHGGVQMLE